MNIATFQGLHQRVKTETAEELQQIIELRRVSFKLMMKVNVDTNVSLMKTSEKLKEITDILNHEREEFDIVQQELENYQEKCVIEEARVKKLEKGLMKTKDKCSRLAEANQELKCLLLKKKEKEKQFEELEVTQFLIVCISHFFYKKLLIETSTVRPRI